MGFSCEGDLIKSAKYNWITYKWAWLSKYRVIKSCIRLLVSSQTTLSVLLDQALEDKG